MLVLSLCSWLGESQMQTACCVDQEPELMGFDEDSLVSRLLICTELASTWHTIGEEQVF